MITDLKAFCELFYASTSIPIAITTLHPTMTVPFLRFWKTRLFLKASCPVSDISQKTRTILSRSPSAIMVI